METEVISKKSAMNELPKGWQVVPIEECLATINGKKKVGQGWSPQCEKEASPSDEQWGVLKTTAIQAGEFLQDENKLLPTTLEPRPQIEVKPGDLLTTCAGPRSRCGVTCLVRETRPRLMISGKMYRYRAKEGFVDAEYLEAYLQTQDAWDAIDKMKTGGSDSGLNLTHERFLQLPIPLAPLPQQRRIVSAIELQLGRLDAAVARLHAAKAKLKRYKQAVLKAAFLGHDAQTHDAGGWSWSTIKDVTVNLDGKRVPLSKTVRAKRQGSIPYYGATGVVDHLDDFLFNGRYLLIGEDGANLLSRSRPLSFIAEGKIWVNNHAHVLQMRDGIDMDYVNLYFNSLDLSQYVTGSAQPKLTQASMNKIPIPLCSMADQRRIVEAVVAQHSAADETETTLDAELVRSTRLRQAVLKRAFEGRLG